MQILTDACLALFASIGIWTLGRWALDWFLTNENEPEILIVIRAHGSGDGLERAVNRLLPRRRSNILMVDCGLNRQGRAVAETLVDRFETVRVCTLEQIGSLMKEAETWTKRKNITK